VGLVFLGLDWIGLGWIACELRLRFNVLMGLAG
jgi:hypothetical protein